MKQKRGNLDYIQRNERKQNHIAHIEKYKMDFKYGQLELPIHAELELVIYRKKIHIINLRCTCLLLMTSLTRV